MCPFCYLRLTVNQKRLPTMGFHYVNQCLIMFDYGLEEGIIVLPILGSFADVQDSSYSAVVRCSTLSPCRRDIALSTSVVCLTLTVEMGEPPS